jgi:hypothetical protein
MRQMLLNWSSLNSLIMPPSQFCQSFLMYLLYHLKVFKSFQHQNLLGIIHYVCSNTGSSNVISKLVGFS